MTNRLKDLSEDEVIKELFEASQHVPQTGIAQVQAEMQRRLIIAIREFNAASEKQATTMIRLTWVIAGLTVVIAVLTGVLVWKEIV